MKPLVTHLWSRLLGRGLVLLRFEPELERRDL